MYQKSLINHRVWAIMAMVCPFLLLIILFIVAPYVPDYDPIKSLISVLSLGEFGWLGSTLFILSAITVMAFGKGISSVIPLDKKSKTALALLNSTAVCLLLLVFINVDNVNGIWTFKRVAHWSITFAVVGFLTVSCFLIADSLKKDAEWKGIYVLTIVIAVITVAVGLGMLLTVHSGFGGGFERLMVVSGVIWEEAMSIRIYRLSHRN
jgi:hypothetical protein